MTSLAGWNGFLIWKVHRATLAREAIRPQISGSLCIPVEDDPVLLHVFAQKDDAIFWYDAMSSLGRADPLQLLLLQNYHYTYSVRSRVKLPLGHFRPEPFSSFRTPVEQNNTADAESVFNGRFGPFELLSPG
jgi:hypothetical protein